MTKLDGKSAAVLRPAQRTSPISHTHPISPETSPPGFLHFSTATALSPRFPRAGRNFLLRIPADFVIIKPYATTYKSRIERRKAL